MKWLASGTRNTLQPGFTQNYCVIAKSQWYSWKFVHTEREWNFLHQLELWKMNGCNIKLDFKTLDALGGFEPVNNKYQLVVDKALALVVRNLIFRGFVSDISRNSKLTQSRTRPVICLSWIPNFMEFQKNIQNENASRKNRTIRMKVRKSSQKLWICRMQVLKIVKFGEVRRSKLRHERQQQKKGLVVRLVRNYGYPGQLLRTYMYL